MWKDNERIVHTLQLCNTLYFLDSLVNILSVTALADQLDDAKGTRIKPDHNYSIFQWHSGQFTHLIQHSSSCLEELEVALGFSTFTIFFIAFSHLQLKPNKFAFTVAMQNLLDDISSTIATEVQYTRERHNDTQFTKFIDIMNTLSTMTFCFQIVTH